MKIRRVDFSPDEWLAGTAELDIAARGVYITACALIYSRGGPIAHNVLRSFCPGDLRVYRRALETLLTLGKLTESDGYLSQKRCISELEVAEKRVVSAAENGRKGGRPSNEINDIKKPAGFFDEKLTINHQLSTTNHQPSTKNLTPKSPTPVRAAKPPPAEAEREFEAWWKVYPRRDDKGHARKAFVTARKKISLAELIAAARKFTVQCAGSEKRFIPLPATWLNGERWGDAALTVRAPSGPSGPPPVSLWRNNWDMASAD